MRRYAFAAIVAASMAVFSSGGVAYGAQVGIKSYEGGSNYDARFFSVPVNDVGLDPGLMASPERNDVEVRVSDGGRSVTFHDRTTPIVTVPPAGHLPCARVDLHTATCTIPDPDNPRAFGGVETVLGSGGSSWTDLPGDQGPILVVKSGPGDDRITSQYARETVVTDLGGVNVFTSKPGNGLFGVYAAPGLNRYEIRNGQHDGVVCNALFGEQQFDDTTGLRDDFDVVVADPDDDVRGCGSEDNVDPPSG